MTMYADLARRILDGHRATPEELTAIAGATTADICQIMAGADRIRSAAFGRTIHLCTITNAKSGKCSEDCAFCAQSGRFSTESPAYPLKAPEVMAQEAKDLSGTPVHRFSMVTSGRGLPAHEVRAIAAAAELMPEDLGCCASLGILDTPSFIRLKAAGIQRYHHNLETSRSHFPTVCTTHTYDDRVQTIRQAKAAGLSVCAGGIFGIGETMDQVVELALALRELDVDAVPVNFLTPVPGTPLAGRADGQEQLSPWTCLTIISLFRYALPDKEIIICGGRAQNLGPLEPMVFFAGASGIMTGNYLTTKGNQLEQDLAMIRELGFKPRSL